MKLVTSSALPPLNHSIIAAVKALSKGEARPDQQVTALNYIVDMLCLTYGPARRPGWTCCDMAEMAGRRLVGIELRRIVTQSLQSLTGKEPEPKEQP